MSANNVVYEALDRIHKAYMEVVAERDRLRETEYVQAKPLLEYKMPRPNALKSYYSDQDFFKKVDDKYYTHGRVPETPDEWEAKAKVFYAQLDTYEADVRVTYELNKEIIEHNKKVVERIKRTMADFGIPATKSEAYYPNSRSKTLKTRVVSAGYLDDISKAFKTYDTIGEQILKQIAERRVRIEKAVKDQTAS